MVPFVQPLPSLSITYSSIESDPRDRSGPENPADTPPLSLLKKLRLKTQKKRRGFQMEAWMVPARGRQTPTLFVLRGGLCVCVCHE